MPNTINSCGTPFSITAFAGGGAGSGAPTGQGNGAAGGSGGAAVNANGCTNTGGGGGGGSGLGCGGNGGPGAVVLRFPSCATISVSPGTNATATHPGGDKIATFTVNGTICVSF